MAFMDKVSSAAKSIGDKGKSTAETMKLNSKIKAEESSITECEKKIGAFIYGLHQAGEDLPEGAADLCAQIDGHNAAIEDARAEIVRIKTAESAPAAAAAPAAEPAAAGAQAFCMSCGAQLPPGMKFCGSCGAKQE